MPGSLVPELGGLLRLRRHLRPAPEGGSWCTERLGIRPVDEEWLVDLVHGFEAGHECEVCGEVGHHRARVDALLPGIVWVCGHCPAIQVWSLRRLTERAATLGAGYPFLQKSS